MKLKVYKMVTTERGKELETLINNNLNNLLFDKLEDANKILNELLSEYIDFDTRFTGFKPYEYNGKCYTGDIYYTSGFDDEYRCSTVTICNDAVKVS